MESFIWSIGPSHGHNVDLKISVFLLKVDPYNELSSESKTFVNNLTAMGFTRPRAARAVHTYGADEREVRPLHTVLLIFIFFKFYLSNMRFRRLSGVTD